MKLLQGLFRLINPLREVLDYKKLVIIQPANYTPPL